MSVLDQFSWLWKGDAAQPTPPATSSARNEGVPLSSIQSWEQLLGDQWSGAGGVSPDAAMRFGAFYACVRIIGGTLSQLPWKTYKTEKAKAGTYTVEAADHRLSPLLRVRPNSRMSAAMFWRMIFSQALSRGNGYAWIERRRSGDVIALWPIPKARCSPRLATEGPLKGRIVYTITLDDGSQVVADMDDVLHIPGSMEWNGYEAKSPLGAYASSVGIGIEANEFAKRYLQNDATPPVTLQTTKVIDQQKADEIRNLWQGLGTGAKRGGVRILAEGMTADNLDINADDAQLLETRKFSALEIAMIFGVPPHMIGAIDKQTSWGSGVEQQSIGFVTYTLGMHISAAEQEIAHKLFRSDGHHVECDVRALLRGDTKSRNEAHRMALGGSAGPGYKTKNEVRQNENLPPDPDPESDKLQGFTTKGAGDAAGDDEKEDDNDPPEDAEPTLDGKAGD